MSSDHAAIMVDHSVEIIDGGLLDVTIMTNTELTQVQVSDEKTHIILSIQNIDNKQNYS